MVDVTKVRELVEEVGEELDGGYYEAPEYMLAYVEAGCEVAPLLELEVVLVLLTEVR